MSSYFSMGNDLRDHWFRIGRTEVGSTLLVVIGVVASWLVGVLTLAGARVDLVPLLSMSVGQVMGGEVWRLVSWPFANGLDLWGVLNLFFFWLFGTELESRLGKVRMAQLLGGIWAALTLVALLVGLVLSPWSGLAGIAMVELVVLLLWIAENPRRPFFFGIPAWVLGAVLVALQALGMLASRNLVGLLSMALSFAAIAILARRLGLLGDLDWIPGRARAPRPGRPTRAAREQARREATRAKDDARLDELLDQISERGIDSLTAAQRRELLKLRNRR